MLLEDQKRKGEVWGMLVKHTGCWVIKEEGTWLQREISLLKNKYIIEEFKDRKRMKMIKCCEGSDFSHKIPREQLTSAKLSNNQNINIYSKKHFPVLMAV